jgi:hypothetical protein
MSKELAVLILDLDKLKEFEGWWERSKYIAKVDDESFQKVTDAVEKIQEEELEGKKNG